MAKVDGVALASIASGIVFCYAGITGKSVLASIQAVVSGKSPSTLPNTNPIVGTGNPNATSQAPGTITGGSVNGAAIAQLAVTYVGHKYVWGGTPGNDGTGGWDCSSFVNYILGVRFNMTLPGGAKYNGLSHGPVASSYQGYGTGIARSSVGAGDLCVWSTHIGIAINSSQMVSALNPSLGTLVTGIESGGPSGESLTCRRIS